MFIGMWVCIYGIMYTHTCTKPAQKAVAEKATDRELSNMLADEMRSRVPLKLHTK